ncbi:platelet-activating factor acetylhydrolase, isoform II-domain-containing protein [Biscogniauxia marginata]|nr:platelet-activating factor acetylhydrolase, isoform II-domain-containing protein [Biscogniauxia marginata]
MAQPASTTDSWSSLLWRLNPVPGFAEYTGPYKVGTVDVEIPVSELDSPAPAPDAAAGIETVQFRIFYPCQPDARGKRITWLPAPQRDHLSAYIQFLGVRTLWAQAASFLPRHLHYTSIPVIKNAPILEPPLPEGEEEENDDEATKSKNTRRWPTAIFSHGLGGSRNTYSQIAGSLASYGIVVVCPEYRDGSAVVSYVRIPPSPDTSAKNQRYFFARGDNSNNTQRSVRVVPYRYIPHESRPEVHAQRDDQLRVRLWELGLAHDAVLRIDADGGARLANLNASTPAAALAQLAGRMRVREPGSVVFVGHSFGASTVVQFLKSVFYAAKGRGRGRGEYAPLYAPRPDSAICRQVTPRNVTILLDMWCFPLLSPHTKALFDLPLPVYYTSPNAPPPPGGAALLAVGSADFYNWTEHLHITARVLSPDPSAPCVTPDMFALSGKDEDGERASLRVPPPSFFYVERAAHLNQSDFGVLFPWLTSKVFGSERPDRVLRLNRRAVLQVLRQNGIGIAGTVGADLVDGRGGSGTRTDDDGAILEGSHDTGIEAWKWIDVMGLGKHGRSSGSDGEEEAQTDEQAVEEKEKAMAGVIEPSAADVEEAGMKNGAVAA